MFSRWSLLTPTRRQDHELMDAPGLPPEEVGDAYATLRRVNRQLGNNRSMDLEIRRCLMEIKVEPTDRLTILDVGSGSGDIPLRLRDRFSSQVQVNALALDRDPTANQLSSKNDLPTIRGDALRLPFADRSVELVTAVKFAHHFEGPGLHRLLSEMARVAALRVILLDIRRHWFAYLGFIVWSRVFTRNRLVRYDGPLSVLRGFTPKELLELTTDLNDFQWTLRRYAGFQLALVGTRNSSK